MVHRLLATVVEAFPYRFETISVFTDSMCSVGALLKSPSSLRPYFCNRVMEINRIREQLGDLCGALPPVCHIPGESNPADLGTRGQVSVGDLGPGSTWQLGPGFLQADFCEWPVPVDVDTAHLQLPPEECKQLEGSTFHVGTTQDQKPLRIMVEQVCMDTKLGSALRQMANEALTREKLEMLTRALARALQAVVAGDREVCRKPPLTKMLELAVRLLVRIASKSAVGALEAGKLRGLGAEVRGSVVWVTGRVRGEQLAELLGTTALPVLMPSEALAWAVMSKAHREDHRRGPRDAAARSRRLAWIPAATRLAKTVVGRCYSCRQKDKKMETQLMGRLPPERLTVVAPFEATALDLFGPFWVKDPAKGRRRFKCWIVAYVCMGAKAVCLLPCPGYGTSDFLTTHRFFTGLFGRPRVIYTDHAPSLIKAAETPTGRR